MTTARTASTSWHSSRLYHEMVRRPVGRMHLSQALQRELIQDAGNRLANDPKQQPMTLVEWMKGIGLSNEGNLLAKAVEQYDNRLDYFVNDDFDAPDGDGWRSLGLELEDEIPPALQDIQPPPTLSLCKIRAGGSNNNASKTNSQMDVRLRLVFALQRIKENGIPREAQRIRLNQKLALREENEEKARKAQEAKGPSNRLRVGTNYLAGKGANNTIRSNPIQEFLEGIDQRLATKYVRILSRNFEFLEDLDETALFFLDRAGCQVLAWERMALLKAIREYRARL
ncbi:unnamed protein product [Amoebophrya sp. A25]|nr:unnamed protein product [Amoebophrya sp. A25]|eukprot:GSA25T00014751001.1